MDGLAAITERLGIEGDASPPRPLWIRTRDGARLHALDWGGEGETVLLLHGGALTARTWDYVCVGLRDRFRLVALDLRGHGESDWSDDYSVDLLANDVADVAQAVSPGALHVVGMSMGGLAGAEFTLAEPHRVKTLTLVDIAPGVVFSASASMRGFLSGMVGAPSVEAVVEAAMRVSPRSDPERLAYRMRALLRQGPDGAWAWKRDGRRPVDYEHILGRLSSLADRMTGFASPVLLVRGERSRVLPRKACEAFVRRLPAGRWTEIAGAGHNVQEDAPAALIGVLADFLARP
jgi:pimeloyl-ACP methyl ester carboxylesterase